MSTASHIAANNIRDFISIFRDPPKQSKFYSDGILTPDEFVKSGDYLVSKCPSWKWCKAEKGYVNKYLPENKQYLKTTVPSYRRASDYLQKNSTKEKVIDGDWVDADLENKSEVKKPEAIDLDDEDKKEKKNVVAATGDDDDDDDDFKIEGDGAVEIVDEEEKKDNQQPNAEIIKSRTYDVTITYDLYYFVPRMWLMGYNEDGKPLSDDEMKEDVMPEYRSKTVTIDPQPCTGIRNISVHPCRHSLLLKKMIKDFQNSGKKLEVEMSILLFLKFLQSVVPTVQYDFTMDIAF